jgi:hypothetical protein
MNLVALAVVYMLLFGFVIAFVGVYDFGKGIEMDIIVSRDVYNLDNALHAAKFVYARNALIYSFHQAAYNISLQGGWKEPENPGLADEDALKGSLANKTLEYYNDYYNIRPVSFLGYSVTLPDYENMTMTDVNDENVTMEAYAEKLMEVSSELENPVTKEKITIRRNASMNLTIPTDIYRVYQKALSYTSSTESSLSSVEHELDKWPLEGSADMDHAVTSSHDDAFYKIIISEYPQLIRDNDFGESTALSDAEAITASQIDLPEGQTTEEDGFVIDNRDSSVKVKITPSCTGYTYLQGGEERSHKDCEFSYRVTVSLRTGIQEKDGPLYPVFTREAVSFEPLRFVFSSDNVYERKP